MSPAATSTHSPAPLQWPASLPMHLGFYDLSGNVWEWCADAYCPGSLARIIRGGSWGSDRPAYLQSANRNPKFPDSRNDETGFRIALRTV